MAPGIPVSGVERDVEDRWSSRACWRISQGMSCPDLHLVYSSSFALYFISIREYKTKNKLYFNKGEYKGYLQLVYLRPEGLAYLHEKRCVVVGYVVDAVVSTGAI